MTDHVCPSSEKIIPVISTQVPIVAKCSCLKKSLPIPEIKSSITYKHNNVSYSNIQDYRKAKLQDVLAMCSISDDDSKKLLDVLPNVLVHLVNIPASDIISECSPSSPCQSKEQVPLDKQSPLDEQVHLSGGLATIKARDRYIKVKFAGIDGSFNEKLNAVSKALDKD